MSRSKLVRDIVMLKRHPMTAREICSELAIPADETKFVSSILAGLLKKKLVDTSFTICGVTGRKATAYVWTGGTAGSPRRPRPRAAQAPKQAGPAPKPAAPGLDPAQLARAEARRKAAEDAARARQKYQAAQMAQDAKRRARLLFVRLTGCASSDPGEMKAAYRRASLKLHPDRGGSAQSMSELNAAWTEIGF